MDADGLVKANLVILSNFIEWAKATFLFKIFKSI